MLRAHAPMITPALVRAGNIGLESVIEEFRLALEIRAADVGFFRYLAGRA